MDFVIACTLPCQGPWSRNSHWSGIWGPSQRDVTCTTDPLAEPPGNSVVLDLRSVLPPLPRISWHWVCSFSSPSSFESSDAGGPIPIPSFEKWGWPGSLDFMNHFQTLLPSFIQPYSLLVFLSCFYSMRSLSWFGAQVNLFFFNLYILSLPWMWSRELGQGKLTTASWHYIFSFRINIYIFSL